MALFSTLSLRKKFLAQILLILLIMSISLYYILMTKQFSHQFLKHEIKNHSYNRKIAELLQDLYKHQILIHRVFNNHTSSIESLKAIQNQISKRFKTLKQKAQPINLAWLLQKENHPENPNWISSLAFEEDWANIQKNSLSIPLEKSDHLHEQLVKDIQAFITFIHFAHDPHFQDQPRYHFYVDKMLQKLPETQGQLVKILILGENAIQAKKLTGEQRYDLLKTIETFRSDLINSNNTHQNFPSPEFMDFNEAFHSYYSNAEEFINVTEQSLLNADSINIKPESFTQLGDKALYSSFTLWNVGSDQLEDLFKDQFKRINQKQNLILAVIIGLTALLLFISWSILQDIFKAIENIQNDLTISMQGNRIPPQTQALPEEFYNLGLKAHQLIVINSNLIDKIQHNNQHALITNSQLSSASKSQENSLDMQQQATNQFLQTIQQFEVSSHEFSRFNQELNTRTKQTAELTTICRNLLNQLEFLQHQYLDSSEDFASTLNRLNEKTATLTTIMTNILKVADRTNLLALNGSIEAEKAGEHGLTFSVIAREIRNLADQTASLTLDIEKMIQEVAQTVSLEFTKITQFIKEAKKTNYTYHLNENFTKILENIHQDMLTLENVNRELSGNRSDHIEKTIQHLDEARKLTKISITQLKEIFQEQKISS